MPRIYIELEVDDEHADEDDNTGLTEVSYEMFLDAVTEFGSIVSGPDRV